MMPPFHLEGGTMKRIGALLLAGLLAVAPRQRSHAVAISPRARETRAVRSTAAPTLTTPLGNETRHSVAPSSTRIHALRTPGRWGHALDTWSTISNR